MSLRGHSKKQAPRGALRFSPATLPQMEQYGEEVQQAVPHSSRPHPAQGLDISNHCLINADVSSGENQICWTDGNCFAAITCWRGVTELHIVIPAGTKKDMDSFLTVLTEWSDLRLKYFHEGYWLTGKKSSFHWLISAHYIRMHLCIKFVSHPGGGKNCLFFLSKFYYTSFNVFKAPLEMAFLEIILKPLIQAPG